MTKKLPRRFVLSVTELLHTDAKKSAWCNCVHLISENQYDILIRLMYRFLGAIFTYQCLLTGMWKRMVWLPSWAPRLEVSRCRTTGESQGLCNMYASSKCE